MTFSHSSYTANHCDHPIGSINLFGYPDSYHRILGILVQSCSILFSQEPSYRMKHHFPHLNMVETRQLLKWLSDIKSQKCGCDYHLGYPLHGSPAFMEASLPTYDQMRDEIHRVQEDWLGTKDEIGSSNIHLYNSNLHLDLVPQEILVTAPELQEDWLGTNTISYCSLGLFLSSSI